MILHPLTMTLLFAEVVSGVIFLSAAMRLWMILPLWQSGKDDAGQPARERTLEVAGFQGSWVFVIQSTGFVLLLAGIGIFWPHHTPGAMCGMGVMQTMGTPGVQALAFKFFTLMVLYGWYAVQKVEGRLPEPAAGEFQGRLLLLALPFLILSDWSLAKALAGANMEQPVSCCTAVYDQAAVIGGSSAGELMTSSPVWILLGMAATTFALSWGWGLSRRPARMLSRISIAPALLLIGAAMPAAFMIFTRITAPYFLEVLHHPCPWCLLLWEHGAPGFILFALPAWLTAESVAVVCVILVARRHGALQKPAAVRLRKAGRRIAAAAVLSAAAAAAPAFWWYLRFGNWMT